MNVFHRIALQNLKKNRARTVVTVVGVALSTALITACVSFGLSLLRYAADGAAQKYGGWHVAFLSVDDEFADALHAEGETSGEAASITAIQNIGYAPLPGGQNPDKPYLCVTGFDQRAFDALPLTLLSGRMPQSSDEVIVPTHVLANGGVQLTPGDTLTLPIGRRTLNGRFLGQGDPYTPQEAFTPAAEQTYTIVGTYARPAFEPYTAAGYTLITVSNTGRLADSLSLFVTLSRPSQVYAYAQRHAQGHAALYNDNVLRFMGLSRSDRLFSALLLSIGCIVIAIIMTGSVFLIYNAFSISLCERTQQLGILASVGATAGQIRRSALFEGLCIGTVGIPLGMAAGLAGMGTVIAVVSQRFASIMYSGVALTLRISAPALACSAALSLITILLSAYIPARKAANTPMMACIRQTNDVKIRPGSLKTPLPVKRLLGLEGELALKNFGRNRRRYRSIVLSLSLSVVLFISTNAFVDALGQALSMAAALTTYDVGFGTQEMEDGQLLSLYEQLKTASGVTKSTYQSVMQAACVVRASDLSPAFWTADGLSSLSTVGDTAQIPVEIQFLDAHTYLEQLNAAGLSTAEYTSDSGRLIAIAKLLPGSDEEKSGKEITDFRDMFAHTDVEATLVPLASGEPNHEQSLPVRFTCVEIVGPDIPPTAQAAPNTEYVFQLLAPFELMEAFPSPAASADIRVKGLTFLTDTPAKTASEMNAMIKQAGVSCAYMLLDSTKVLEENRNYIFIANVFSYTFIAMISLIAVANVLNTISTNIRLRRRELAMLRSVGMADASFARMMRFECAFYGLRALLVGLPLALALSVLIYQGMAQGGADEIVYRFPLASVVISIGGVLTVIFVTMMYAVRKLRHENIINALRDDLT